MKLFKFILPVLAGIALISSQAVAQSELTKNYECKQCNEDVIALRLDPAPIQEAVGSNFVLMLEEKKAMVAIFVQDCSQYWIDGKSLGRNQQVHVLVRIEGPQDVRPVVGAQNTAPTFTWFSLFAGSTNPKDQEARSASHTAPQPIESVILDSLGSSRGGEVTIGPGLNFSWSVRSATEGRNLMGVNHDIYMHDVAGDIILKRIQAIGNLVAAPSPGKLKVVGGADPNRLIGAGEYPALVYTFFPVWARATLGDESSH